MSNELWLCVCALTGFALYVFGVWRGNKDTERKDKELKRKDEELRRTRDSAEHWEAETQSYKNRLFAKQSSEYIETLHLKRELESLKTDNCNLKKLYADELQKRLELAELVQKHEQVQKDTAEFVTEAIKTAKAEVDRGEVSSGD